MKKFEDVMSPLSWLLTVVLFNLLFLLILRPSAFEFLIFVLVDYTAVAVTKIIDPRLFVRLYPDVFLYFLSEKIPQIKDCTVEQKLSLLESMRRFPARRALYCMLLSLPKSLPGTLVAVLFWKHSISNFSQTLLVISLGLVGWAYFYAAVFIENHELVSRKIAEFHRMYEWSDVFRKVTFPFDRRVLDLHETTGIVSIWVFVMLLQWMVITRTTSSAPSHLAFMVGVIGASGLMLITRIWYLGKRYFVGGLGEIFSSLEKIDPEMSQETLPLHSDQILAHFEKIVNGLVDRLRSYRQELSRWVFYQTEESRYRALGELSALIVHDLSAPLHVIHFCTEQIKENPDMSRNARYIDQLTVNGTRSLELINSLKAYLKDGKFMSAGVAYEEAHRQVLRLLETQFHTNGFNKVKFDTDPQAMPIKVNIPKADLIHVLMNLYSNSVLNLLQNGIASPMIRISLAKTNETEITFVIEDNGTGLSVERFEELTAFSFLPGSDGYSRDGLGLRLVRRLVERNKGSLRAIEPKAGEPGSRFHLTLKFFTHLDQADQNGKTSNTENVKTDLGD